MAWEDDYINGAFASDAAMRQFLEEISDAQWPMASRRISVALHEAMRGVHQAQDTPPDREGIDQDPATIETGLDRAPLSRKREIFDEVRARRGR